MELVDRYLQAVRFWLPGEQQEDIARELSEDIVSEIEEEERGLGRLMTRTEIEAVLKRRGSPFVVANRYLPQRSLIGPLLLPMYLFVLKLIALVYVLPWIIVWAFILVFFPAHRAEVARDLGTLWSLVVQLFAGVTILFAIGERHLHGAKLLADWNPQHLPALRKRATSRIPRASSIAELVCMVLFIAWWCGGYPIAFAFDWQHRWSSGTIWPEIHRGLFLPMLLIAGAGLAVTATNLVRPYWTRTRRVMRAITNGATAALAGWTALVHFKPIAKPLTLDAAADLGVLIALAVVAAVCAAICARGLYLAAAASSTYGTTSKLRS
jgi:hypothetical protein